MAGNVVASGAFGLDDRSGGKSCTAHQHTFRLSGGTRRRRTMPPGTRPCPEKNESTPRGTAAPGQGDVAASGGEHARIHVRFLLMHQRPDGGQGPPAPMRGNRMPATPCGHCRASGDAMPTPSATTPRHFPACQSLTQPACRVVPSVTWATRRRRTACPTAAGLCPRTQLAGIMEAGRHGRGGVPSAAKKPQVGTCGRAGVLRNGFLTPAGQRRQAQKASPRQVRASTDRMQRAKNAVLRSARAGGGTPSACLGGAMSPCGVAPARPASFAWGGGARSRQRGRRRTLTQRQE
jgi:hypothetical protein